MIHSDHVGFGLATFQSGQHERVGLVLGGRLFEINQALSVYRRRGERKDVGASPICSMLDILAAWPHFLGLFRDLALFLKGDLNEELDFQEIRTASLLAPVPRPGKMVNAGLNFSDHAREMGIEIPSEGFRPNFFFKGDRHCLIGPSQNIQLSSAWVDWEAELAVIIGKKAKNVRADEAMKVVAGFTCHNDITDRRLMLKSDGSLDFFAGKSRDTFGPLGPFLVPTEFIPDRRNLRIRCFLNDEVMQDTDTSQMIWGVEQCIEYISSCVTLEPGDVIALGSGAGVGWAKGIKVNVGEFRRLIDHMNHGGGTFLRSGDRVAVEIDGVGRLENIVG